MEGHQEFYARADAAGQRPQFPPETFSGAPIPPATKTKLNAIGEECKAMQETLSKVRPSPALGPRLKAVVMWLLRCWLWLRISKPGRNPQHVSPI